MTLADQCDQIWRFIGLWQQLIFPNLPHSKAIFKGVKIFNFSSEIILGNFSRHLATFYWSHSTLLAITYNFLNYGKISTSD